MKRVEYTSVHKIGGADVKLSRFEFRFTDEEKDHLLKLLPPGVKDDCKREFGAHLQHLCHCVLMCLSETPGLKYRRPSRVDRKTKIHDYEKTLKKALDVVGKLSQMNLPPSRSYSLGELLAPNQPVDDWSEMQRCAYGAKMDIQKLLDILGRATDYTLPQGSPGTISADFAEQIGDAYMEHIGRPTSTPSSYPGSGAFHAVVDWAFGVVGLDNLDVSKAVLKAIPKTM